MRPMRIDLEEYSVLKCRQIVDGKTVEYLTLAGTNGHAAAIGRSRGELLGDFRRRQIEAADASTVNAPARRTVNG